MAAPSGQTIILLRDYADRPQDIAFQAKACVEYIRANGLPNYVPPIVEESLNPHRPLWTSTAGVWFWTLCQSGWHVVVYTIDAFSRNRHDRRDSIKKVLDKGARLHQAGPPVMEITQSVLQGMILDTPEVIKTKRLPWGKKKEFAERHGARFEMWVDNEPELTIGNQIVGRVMLGETAKDVLKWLKKTRTIPHRWPARLWTFEKVRKVLKSFVGPDHPAYGKWCNMRGKEDRRCTRMWQ